MKRYSGSELRVYRATSWIDRAKALAETAEEPSGRRAKSLMDEQLIFYWIALNALYGQPRYVENRPELPDLFSFLRRLRELDVSGGLEKALGSVRDEQKRLLDDIYLDRRYWHEWDKRGIVEKREREALVLPPRRAPHLEELFYRIYELRNQVFHGSSTRGSSSNQRGVRDAVAVLRAVVSTCLRIVKEEGAHEVILNKAPYLPSVAPDSALRPD
jgi:hypothetical protein